MKKVSLLFMAMVAAFALQAQWTNDPSTNNLIGNHQSTVITSGEILTVTDVETNDTYFHWGVFKNENGYIATFQRLTADGTPQWGPDGISLTQFHYINHSDGRAIDITPDHDLLACFSTVDTTTVAMRFHPDGTYAWGEQGILLFDGKGGIRAEIIAGKDNGAWALGNDHDNLYLQYIEADGTLNPLITIEAPNDTTISSYGKLVLRDDNSVFLTYEHVYVYEEGGSLSSVVDIHLTGYAKDGTQTLPDVKLMGELNNTATYTQQVAPDGLGGAYVYINQGDTEFQQLFNIRVFHFDADGNSTISDTLGVTVHSTDMAHVYIQPYTSVDPVSHDLLITYIQGTGSQNDKKLFVNRITATGERVWDDGVLVFYNNGRPISIPTIAAFEDGSGFAVAYFKWEEDGVPNSTLQAVGMDMNCNVLWQTTLSSSEYMREYPETISGFHHGQCIIAWANDDDNSNIYAQNFGVSGVMGQGADVNENVVEDEEIVTIVRIINLNGQTLLCKDVNELTPGIYILQGMNKDGKMVNKKTVVTKE